MTMKTSVAEVLLSVLTAGFLTGCSSDPKVVDSFCELASVVEPDGGRVFDYFRLLLFDDGSIEAMRDADGKLVNCEDYSSMNLGPTSE